MTPPASHPTLHLTSLPLSRRRRPGARRWWPSFDSKLAAAAAPEHSRSTAHAAQPSPADHAGHRPLRSPRSDLVAHAPWTPRACNAFPSVHTSISLAPRTVLHGIERALTRHTRLALLRLDVSCS
jgi:hypothetical protein